VAFGQQHLGQADTVARETLRASTISGLAGHAGDVERLAEYCREWLTGSAGRPLDPAATGAAR